MAMAIWSGVCLDGPLEGHFHTQTAIPPVTGGVFNYVGLAGIKGSYQFALSKNGWCWGPWIEEHPEGSTWEGRRIHEQYDGNGKRTDALLAVADAKQAAFRAEAKEFADVCPTCKGERQITVFRRNDNSEIMIDRLGFANVTSFGIATTVPCPGCTTAQPPGAPGGA